MGKTALENEEGHWQYSVNVRSGKTLREVMVDAYSGKIASAEVTTPAEEAKEAREEAKKTAPHKSEVGEQKDDEKEDKEDNEKD